MTPVTALKATIPLAFFGYAVFANISLLVDETVTFNPAAKGALNGKVTQEIDTVYREQLPHKDPAVGLIGAARYVLLDEGRSGVVVGRNGTLFTSEEFRTDENNTYALAVARIKEVADQLEQQGIKLIVAPLPAKVDLLREHSPDAAQAELQETAYHQFLADLGLLSIQAVDTRAVLASLEQPFLQTDTHWTPDGAAAVAKQVADSGSLDLGDEEFTVNSLENITFTGDLVTYVTTEAFAPIVGLATENVTPYNAIKQVGETDVVDIFGSSSDGSPILDLVGTSYSANPNWSFAEALKLATRRDVINHAEEGQGPFAPMLSYLDQIDPFESATEVVWEIPVRYLTDPKMVAKTPEGKA